MILTVRRRSLVLVLALFVLFLNASGCVSWSHRPNNVSQVEDFRERLALKPTDRVAVVSAVEFRGILFTSYGLYGQAEKVEARSMEPDSINMAYAQRVARELNEQGVESGAGRVVYGMEEPMREFGTELARAWGKGQPFDQACPEHLLDGLAEAAGASRGSCSSEEVKRAVRNCFRQYWDVLDSPTYLLTDSHPTRHANLEDYDAAIHVGRGRWRDPHWGWTWTTCTLCLSSLGVFPTYETSDLVYDVTVANFRTGSSETFEFHYGHSELTSVLFLPLFNLAAYDPDKFNEFVNKRLRRDLRRTVLKAMER